MALEPSLASAEEPGARGSSLPGSDLVRNRGLGSRAPSGPGVNAARRQRYE